MALVLADRIQETASAPGTATLTLAGASLGYKTFASGVGSGNTTYYTIVDATANVWEVGIGTVGTGTLSRDTVLSNSSGTTAKINFANSVTVWCDYPAGKSVYLDGSNVLTLSVPEVISVNSASDALRITQTGAGNALLVEDSANPDSTPFVIDTNGRILSGSTTSYATFNDYVNTARRPQFQFNGASVPASMFVLANWSALSSAPALFNLAKSRGAEIGTQGVVSSGDDIGVIEFSADDGTNFVPAAIIMAEVDGTPGTNDMPGRLVFSTTADGASSPTEALRINSLQQVFIGGTTNANDSFCVGGTSTITAAAAARSITARQTYPTTANTHNGYYMVGGGASSATPYTTAVVAGFQVGAYVKGTNQTVTDGYGFLCSTQTGLTTNFYGFSCSSQTGATNNYGFYSNIASGTGRYNFYAAGTADNYFAGSLGIGSVPYAGVNVYSNKAITGATVSANFVSTSTILSDVTNRSDSFISYTGTQAAAFTLGSLRHFGAYQATIGAGSAVSGQYGFFADGGLTGATNNYGFYSNIASGTGRYNFYAAGTADNYFAGAVFVGGILGGDTKFAIGGTLPSGGSSSFANRVVVTAPSASTSVAVGFDTSISTTAASYTLDTLIHHNASQGTIGAGSTVTSQRGFSAQATLTGATNNYGFYSNIASGTGRYNFYAAGTADNYFAGTVTSNATLQGSAVSASNGLFVNNNTVSANYSIPSSYNASSAGPVTVASGITVTIPSGSNWVII